MLPELDHFALYVYDDIPDQKKVFSPDRKYALYRYVSSHHEDRYDNDTLYDIVVWNVADKKELRVITKGCNESYYLNTRERDIQSVGFSEDGSHIVIKYDDGTEEREPVHRKANVDLKRRFAL